MRLVTGLSLLLDGGEELSGETVKTSRNQDQSRQPDKGAAKLFVADESHPAIYLSKGPGVDRVNPETFSLPDDLLSRFALGDARRYFYRQSKWPNHEGETGPRRHLLAFDQVTALTGGIPVVPFFQGGKESPDNGHGRCYLNLFSDKHNFVTGLASPHHQNYM